MVWWMNERVEYRMATMAHSAPVMPRIGRARNDGFREPIRDLERQRWDRQIVVGSQILSGSGVESAVLHADWWNAVIGGNIAL